MKYLIYMSLSYNSHDFHYEADFGTGDFQYTCLLASRAHAHDLLLVSVLVLVLEVELKLSIIIVSYTRE
jgi:hypothetical protein